MHTAILLDRIAEFVNQIIVQIQFWLWLGGLTAGAAILIAVGGAIVQLLVHFDSNDTGSLLRR